MARERGKGLTGFDDVVNSPKLNNTEPNVNNADNMGVNHNSTFNKIDDPLERLRNELPSKQLTTVLKGIYFDNEVNAVIDKQAERLGRGGKSRLVNDVMKDYFMKKGLL